MAATAEGTLEHEAGCMCSGCMCDEAGGHDATGGSSSEASGGTVVDDYTALLYYPSYSPGRWNATTDLGTQVVVTYSFTDTEDLPLLADYDPYDAEGYWAYDEAQRALLREVLKKFEDVAGIKFVEVEGSAMINIFGADVSGVGGWANIPASYSSSTSNGTFVNAYSSMEEGDYGYQVNLHELGHALGLKHPHDGSVTLSADMDTQANTVMTYNIEWPYTTELGPLDIAALQDIYGTADAFDNWLVSVNDADTVTIRASGAAEVIMATDQDTVIFALGGDDKIIGREGDDKALGGNGNDTIQGSTGQDILAGGAGDDFIYGHLSASDFGGDEEDRDILNGNAGNDILYGNAGSDIMNGGFDNDTLYGGNDNDFVLGSNGTDVLYGGYGDDKLSGGSGDDILVGGDGADLLLGQGGSDTFVFTSADAYELDKILGFETGSDVIDLSDFGFMTYGSLSIEQNGLHTNISYSDWFEIQLVNFDSTALSADDFVFV